MTKPGVQLNVYFMTITPGQKQYFFIKSRKENPQKLTQLSSRSHPRHLLGKRTAQKDATTDTTSESQANSNPPNRRPPASPTLNNHLYLLSHSYTTRATTNNNAPHPKPSKFADAAIL